MASSKDTGPTLPGLMTCVPSEPTTSPPSISSAEEAPAKTCLTLGKVLASTVPGLVFGSSTRESLASFDRASSSWKTSQLSLLAGLTECSVVLPKAGMMRSGCLYALPTLERHTDGSGCSSSLGEFPTPTNADGEKGSEVYPGNHNPTLLGAVRANWPTATVQDGENCGGPSQKARNTPPLNAAVTMWMTPTREGFDARGHRGAKDTLHSQIKAWPTPQGYAKGNEANHPPGVTPLDLAARPELCPGYRGRPEWGTPSTADGMGGHLSRSGDRREELLLPGQAKQGQQAGTLNPVWVESLMGFPPGWTEVGPAAPAKRKPPGKPRASRKAARKGQPA